MEFDWINLLQVLGGVILGTGVGVFTVKATIRKSNAEADKAEHEANKAETDRLLSELDHQQKTIENLLDLNTNLTERLSKLNATVDKHIDRNRELSDRVYKSETELNRLNGRLLTVTEERDDARREADYLKMWRCERTDCRDPRGPKPPREKLKGLRYDPPKKS